MQLSLQRCVVGDTSESAAGVVALVEDPPEVDDFARDEIVVLEGRRLELPECRAAAGNPPPTAEWQSGAADVDSVTAQGRARARSLDGAFSMNTNANLWASYSKGHS